MSIFEFLFFLLLAVIALSIAWRCGFFLRPTIPSRWGEGRSPVPLLAVIGGFVIYFGSLLIVVPLAFVLLKSEGWAQVIGIVLGALILLLFLRILPIRGAIWGRFSWRAVGLGVISWMVAYPTAATIGSLANAIFGPFDVEQVAVEKVKSTLGNPPLFIAMAFAVVIVGPIIEELLFRGFFQTWLRRYLPISWAIVCSSLFFALFHFSMSQGLLNLQLLPMLLILGAFLGYLYERQQSLWAPIGLHVVFNALSAFGLLVDKQS